MHPNDMRIEVSLYVRKICSYQEEFVRPPIQITYVRRGKQEARGKQRGQRGE